MIKLSVGYQHSDRYNFTDVIKKYADSISDVYFAWVDCASGRSVIGGYDGYFDYGLQNILIRDLKLIKSLGIKLNLLFNANCYGEDAISEVLAGKVCSVIDFLSDNAVMPDIITTTSPAVAFIVKERYENIELKASVNMKIATVKGMQYVSHLFDSYCVAKECNRDIELLKKLAKWAAENNKKITILANSGCMRDCSGQIFHDNMVAHEAEISKQKNIECMPYMCWNYLKNPTNHISVLQNTWVRPEDLNNYEGIVDTVKIATRSHQLPMMVIASYAKRKYSGNLLDLFEPGHGPALAPYVVDNDKFPSDWFARTSSCKNDCENCTYCKSVWEKVYVNTEM